MVCYQSSTPTFFVVTLTQHLLHVTLTVTMASCWFVINWHALIWFIPRFTLLIRPHTQFHSVLLESQHFLQHFKMKGNVVPSGFLAAASQLICRPDLWGFSGTAKSQWAMTSEYTHWACWAYIRPVWTFRVSQSSCVCHAVVQQCLWARASGAFYQPTNQPNSG